MKNRKSVKTAELTENEDKILRMSSNLLELCSQTVPLGIGSLLADHKVILSMIEQMTMEQIGSKQVVPDQQRQSDLCEFLEWCKSRGVQKEGVEVGSVSSVEGWGLVASRDLKKGECLVKVPLKAMLTLHDAKMSNSLAKPIQLDPLLKGMPNVALALFILVETFRGKESVWEPYLSMLPKSYSTPLYLTESELSLLRGSPTLEATLKLYRNIARQFAYFHQLLGTPNSCMWQGNLSPLSLTNFTFDQYRWAVVTVMTRINLVPCPDSSHPMPALIPFFDLANHRGGPEYNVTTDYSDHLMMGLCYAQADFTAGSQVYINYGARSNADLLLHDGFVPHENNPHDTHKIRLGLSNNDKYAALRAQVLQMLGIVHTRNANHSYDFEIPVVGLQKPLGDLVEIHWRPLITANLQAFARVFTADEDVLKKVVEDNNDDAPLSTNTKIGGIKNEVKAWTFLKNRFSLLLRGYPSPPPIEQSVRVIMASRLIDAEKQLLQAAANYAEDEIKEIMQTNSDTLNTY